MEYIGSDDCGVEGCRQAPSYRDQERRKASDEVVPETSVSPLVRSVYRGTFGVSSRVPSTVLHFKTECETSLETL